MDGNGRWARRRGLPRIAGHRAGIRPVREVIQASEELGIGVLTLFAFSSENWRRPPEEVRLLWELIGAVIESELQALHESKVRLRVIGDRRGLNLALQDRIHRAEHLTAGNSDLQLFIAVNYGGRWDITVAAQRLARQVAAGALLPEEVTAETLSAETALGQVADVDLLIRTGGERRVSNFLLWQLAYSELYFSDTLWPDFHQPEYAQALTWFASRERRYGRISEQVEATA
jgi:undecaprenyl diphosphate synthase